MTYASSDDNTCERNQFTVFAPALFERRKKKQPILSHNRLTSLISSNPDVPAHIKFRMLRLSIQSRLEVYDAGHAFSLSLVLLRCVRTAVSVLTLFVPADAAPLSSPTLGRTANAAFLRSLPPEDLSNPEQIKTDDLWRKRRRLPFPLRRR